MPIIKPISSLTNKTREIATICHEQDEPVYLTTNGQGDLVVMSIILPIPVFPHGLLHCRAIVV